MRTINRNLDLLDEIEGRSERDQRDHTVFVTAIVIDFLFVFSLPLMIWDIETILLMGPLLCLLGGVLFILGLIRKRYWAAFTGIGLSIITMVVFFTILIFRLGSSDASRIIPYETMVLLALYLPISIVFLIKEYRKG